MGVRIDSHDVLMLSAFEGVWYGLPIMGTWYGIELFIIDNRNDDDEY